MLKIAKIFLVIAISLLWMNSAFASIIVTNKVSKTIDVQVERGSKIEIKHNDRVAFNVDKREATVTVYASGQEKASSRIKDDQKVRVTNSGGTWSIVKE